MSENKNDKKRDEKLPFESPQNEESKRLSKKKSKPAVELKSKHPDDEGHTRGGNRSVNQG
jgi:hypothetical protein